MAPKKSKAPKIPPIAHVGEFRLVVDGIASNILQRDQIALELEEALAAVRTQYAPRLEPLDKAIAEQFKRATKFAVTKRADLFAKDAKTSVTALAEFGFRAGNGTLSLVGGWSWEDVVDAIQLKIDELEARWLESAIPNRNEITADLHKWKELIVTRTDPVKDEIKSRLTDDERAQIGTKIAKTENFWIEPKREKEAPISTGSGVAA